MYYFLKNYLLSGIDDKYIKKLIGSLVELVKILLCVYYCHGSNSERKKKDHLHGFNFP